MASSRPSRPKPSIATIALRVVTYFVVAWGTIITLAGGLFPGARLAAVALAVYATIPLLVYIRWRGWPFYPGALFRLFVVRPFWYTQLLLPIVSAAGLAGLMIGFPFGHALAIGQIVAGAVLSVMLVLLALGYLGSKKLVVREVEAHVRDLPSEFDGLRIVQLSDLHVGPHTSRHFLGKVVDATRALAPDLVAITGDLIDDRAEDVAVFARVLGAIDAPMGVYIIPGNHDVYAGWEDVERALRKTDLGTVLVNESEVIHRGDATLALVGTGDPAGGRRGSSRAAPDLEMAMADVPSDATVVAFAHNPALWPALAKRGVALTLSGHTHWGQLALPGLGWSLASPFLEHAMGAHVEHDAVLYISPGTGYWGIPFRLGASPEVTLVTLRAASSSSARVHAPRVHRRRRKRRKQAA
jgi:predicted MPP superfamily phosphohydrolase